MEKYLNRFGEAFALREQIAKGPEGGFYMLSTGKILKLFHQVPLLPERAMKIEALLAREIVMDGLIWPEEAAYNGAGALVGYTMPRLKGRLLHKSVWGKALIEKYYPNWNRKHLANLCLSIVHLFDALHENHILMGNVNGLNIFIQHEKEIYFCNTDHYQINNLPCPLATPLFTRPALQNTDFSTYVRTLEDENFAIAVLIFKTLFPGKDPLNHLPDTLPTFIFSQADKNSTRKGSWDYLWFEQSETLRKTFSQVFEAQLNIDTKTWIQVLVSYLDDLEEEAVSEVIFPSDTTKRKLGGRSTSMNQMDEEAGGTTETILTPEQDSIAVLELSTKAVKILIGDLPRIATEGFSFEAFYREADLTNTGLGLDKDNQMDMEYFTEEVLPSIERTIELARHRRIGKLYTVATAAYRSAANRTEILNFLKARTGINIGILSKAEEAQATLTAFKFSRKPTLQLLPEIILIDQGGGSTEISLFSLQGDLRHTLKQTHSLDLGTTVLQNILFGQNSEDTLIRDALQGVDEVIEHKVAEYFEKFPADEIERSCVSVGSCITNATGKKGNRHQHCMILTAKHLIRALETTEAKLINEFKTVGDLQFELEESASRKDKEWIDSFLTIRLGLPMYMALLGEYDINEVIVSGTGLWYGVYFEKAIPILRQLIQKRV